MNTQYLVTITTVAFVLSGCVSDFLVRMNVSSPPVANVPALVEDTIEISVLSLPTQGDPVVELLVLNNGKSVDGIQARVTSPHGKAINPVTDELGHLFIDLPAHFEDRPLPGEELVLTVSLGKSVKQIRIGHPHKFGYRHVELPAGEYLWLASASSKAIAGAKVFRTKRAWRAQLTGEKNNFIGLCRSDGTKGWIVKLGANNKSFYLIDHEPSKCS